MLSPLRSVPLIASLLAASSLVTAQTWTSCNPLNATCPSDEALGTTAAFNFTNYGTSNTAIWNTTAGTVNYEQDGAEFTINERGDSPTIQSNFYIFFGRVSAIMTAAPGTGIVSSLVLESDDLDEVDLEFIGGNSTFFETNYFGKGNTTSYDRAIWYPVNDTQSTHNYTINWTAEQLRWYLDGNLVRTLKYEDALNGTNYPQTPMTVKLGIWAGGDPDENSNGTVEWAGGDVDYTKGPFTMVVAALEVEDYSTGSSYTYGDHTGSYTSIKIASGNSTIEEDLSKSQEESLKARWSALSRTAQIAIAASVLGLAGVLAIAFAVYCIKSRRAGRKERLLADAEYDKDVTEVQMYKRALVTESEIHAPRPRFI